ncbi:tetratricopeptide repeat protein [Rubrimonas cliftonensis]|uniref:Sel1 repeat-containing protein n=1 Tax=Rubrimonas cliftonensis TaxID=89524 RepID=A0A1H4DMV7_9RHOB|nr:SEL1-like repeat protein [Rubrimonas cliftonensis]SEA73770.1 Sel1 repeat-containing protein [Rubrimonas cliftonensis]
MRRGALAAVLLLGLAGPAPAQQTGFPPQATRAEAADAAPGQAAFDRRDYAEAARLWREAAGAGSAAAKFGLGLIADLGLGAPRDAARARRWFLDAAEAGHASAQFNVAVMLDSGADGLRDVEAAALWYGHAAARGAARAPFNLGLMFAAGDGAPVNPGVAASWMAKAAEAIPAARERIAALRAAAAVAPRVFEAPTPLGALAAPDGVSLAWSLRPAPLGATVLVELADAQGRPAAPPVLLQADAPTAILAQAPPEVALLWRVSLIDAAGARSATMGWRPARGDVPGPRGRLVLSHAPGDAAAARLAAALASGFSRAGFWVSALAEPGAAAATAVSYRFAEDAALARSVAASLPALDASAVGAPEDGPGGGAPASPGAVRVRLVGGPAP